MVKEVELGCDDVEMRVLLEDLPGWLIASKASATVNKYKTYYAKYKQFMQRNNKDHLPASGFHVCLFCVYLLNAKVSHGVLVSYISSIKWMHELCGYVSPTSSVHVKNLVEASKRSNVKKCNKKDIISADSIKLLFSKYENNTDLFVMRDLTMIIIAFAAFLRYDELSQLKCNDLTFSEGFARIIIPKSKNDQYRDGSEILLSELDSIACPVKALRKYIEVSNVNLHSNDYLFKGMYRNSKGVGLRKQQKKLSYTRTREILISRLREVVSSKFNLGLHSLRAGGATAAANSGVNDRCWRRHGRWRSDAANGYIKDTLASRLSVSKSLGL